MAPAISRLVSSCFYADEQLEAARGCSPELYAFLSPVLDDEVTWIDTTSLKSRAYESREGVSYKNEGETRCIVRLLRLISGSVEFWKLYDSQEKPITPAIGVFACTPRKRRC